MELASPHLRRWISPEEDPDSCQLALVTEQLCASGIPNSGWLVSVGRPVVLNS
jgi:hypothetical protein